MIEPTVADYLGRFEDVSADGSGSEVSDAVKAYIGASQGYLREIHESGGSGREAGEPGEDRAPASVDRPP